MRQLERRLSRDYLTTNAMKNQFITREELANTRHARREWWPIAIAAMQLSVTAADMILILAKVH